jgi:hypothetical protein
MNRRTLALSAIVTCGLCSSLTLLAQPPAKEAPRPEAKTAPQPRVTVSEARAQAKLMYEIYSNTLIVTHHYYFRKEGTTLPSRAMEDVFEQIEKDSKIQAKWIAVNTPAMSVNHEPETSFEKKAVEELTAGKKEYERVEDGYYRRAGVIPLGVGCVGCHTKLFNAGAGAKTPKFAGLVISIPVKE